jgi:hypothetical protein
MRVRAFILHLDVIAAILRHLPTSRPRAFSRSRLLDLELHFHRPLRRR